MKLAFIIQLEIITWEIERITFRLLKSCNRDSKYRFKLHTHWHKLLFHKFSLEKNKGNTMCGMEESKHSKFKVTLKDLKKIISILHGFAVLLVSHCVCRARLMPPRQLFGPDQGLSHSRLRRGASFWPSPTWSTAWTPRHLRPRYHLAITLTTKYIRE